MLKTLHVTLLFYLLLSCIATLFLRYPVFVIGTLLQTDNDGTDDDDDDDDDCCRKI